MANDLYDTGQPKRIIVEHEHRVTHEVQPVRTGGYCTQNPLMTCRDMLHSGGLCDRCEFRQQRSSRVTITPEFEVVREPKKLK